MSREEERSVSSPSPPPQRNVVPPRLAQAKPTERARSVGAKTKRNDRSNSPLDAVVYTESMVMPTLGEQFWLKRGPIFIRAFLTPKAEVRRDLLTQMRTHPESYFVEDEDGWVRFDKRQAGAAAKRE